MDKFKKVRKTLSSLVQRVSSSEPSLQSGGANGSEEFVSGKNASVDSYFHTLSNDISNSGSKRSVIDLQHWPDDEQLEIAPISLAVYMEDTLGVCTLMLQLTQDQDGLFNTILSHKLLHLCAHHGSSQVFDYLLRSFSKEEKKTLLSDVDNDQKSPLHLAYSYDNQELIEAMLMAGASFYSPPPQGIIGELVKTTIVEEWPDYLLLEECDDGMEC